MTDLSKNSAYVAEEYQVFVFEIFRRLGAIRLSLDEILANPIHANVWQNCDFCCLQFRKVCEYVAVSMTAVHCDYFDETVNLKKWKPKELLTQVSNFNVFPLPIPISGPQHSRQGTTHLVPLCKAVRVNDISRIYGLCGDVLHVGSLDRIQKMKMPSYNIEQMIGWLRGFDALLVNHVVLLPKIQEALVCLNGNQGSAAKIFAVSARSESCFATDNLAEFDGLSG
jgi:hypothetical protein